MTEFDGKVAVVTGGANGIGRAAVETFTERGAAAVVVDRDGDGASEVAKEAIARGHRAIAVTADVGDEGAVQSAIDAAVSEYGGIDFLFASAAIFRYGTVLEAEPAAWDEVMAVNLRGLYLCVRGAIPEMAKRGGGVIVATSSDTAIRSCNRAAAYVASKVGIIGLVRALAVDHGHQGIRANVVTPGVTDTPGLRGAYSTGDRTAAEGLARGAALSPLGRVGQARDLAEAVVFLCSDRASFITGANLLVDGGMTVTYGAQMGDR